MTLQKLERGNEIQSALYNLRFQLEFFNSKDSMLLTKLYDSCSKQPIDVAMDIESKSRVYSKKLINAKIAELEKEFDKL